MKLSDKIIIFVLLSLVSCGKIRVDGKHKIDAETYSYVIIRLDFIKQIQELCTDLYPAYEIPKEHTRKKLISECTLDKMTIFDMSAFKEFNDTVCKAPLTIEELRICDVFKSNYETTETI